MSRGERADARIGIELQHRVELKHPARTLCTVLFVLARSDPLRRRGAPVMNREGGSNGSVQLSSTGPTMSRRSSRTKGSTRLPDGLVKQKHTKSRPRSTRLWLGVVVDRAQHP